jgi:hypothetical protein
MLLGAHLTDKLLFVGGIGIGRDDDPSNFDFLWRSWDLIKSAGETGGDALGKCSALSGMT